MLMNIKLHMATHPDETPARLMQEAADQLVPILTVISEAAISCQLVEHIV